MVDGSPSDESMLALKSNSWYEDDQLRYQRRTETIDGRGVTGRARAQRRLFLRELERKYHDESNSSRIPMYG